MEKIVINNALLFEIYHKTFIASKSRRLHADKPGQVYHYKKNNHIIILMTWVFAKWNPLVKSLCLPVLKQTSVS